MSILKAKKSDGGWAEIHSVKATTQSTGDFTQDATATADDIVFDKTAYVKGQKLTGTIPTIDDVVAEYHDCDIAEVEDGIYAIKYNDTKYVRAAETYDVLWLQKDQLGDATTGDVISGKTFTSANGLKLTGTYVPSTTTVNLQTKTVSPTTSKQIVTPDSGYTGLSQVTVNAMASGGLGTPSISVATNGVITATANVGTSGYLSSGTTAYNTLTLSSAHDSDFVASNIRSGKTIFGVTGTYTGTSGVTLPSLTTPASAANILSGYEAINASGAKITGTMTNRGTTNGTISTKAGSYTIQSGYHSGSGKVSISSTEQAKIIAGNIKQGVSILGVTGTYAGSGTTLPTLTTPASASHIIKGKEAINASGTKMTGTMPHIADAGLNITGLESYTGDPIYDTANGKIGFYGFLDVQGTPCYIDDGALFGIWADASTFGNATAADVVSGKTFTSQAGALVTGTYTPPSIDAGIVGIKMGTHYDSSNSTDTLTVTHNLGVIPNFGILVAKSANTLSPSNLYISSSQYGVLAHLQVNRPYKYSSTSLPFLTLTTHAVSSSTTGWGTGRGQVAGSDATTTSFTFHFGNQYNRLKAGVEYTWIVGATKSPYIPGGV